MGRSSRLDQVAREYLDHLIDGKTLRMDVYCRDQYNPILAMIWDGQVNVNLLMVAIGYAEVYHRAHCQVYCRELERAEAKAKHDRVGMLRQASYESPAAFRRRLRLSGE